MARDGRKLVPLLLPATMSAEDRAMKDAVKKTLVVLVLALATLGYSQEAKPETPAAKTPAASSAPKTPPEFKPTEAEMWRMTAAQQEFYRWQDKVNGAAEKFGQACKTMQEAHHWPNVVCHIDTLEVTARDAPAPTPVPPATPPAVPAAPAATKEKSPDVADKPKH
jgi:hypothetical protein